MYVEILPYRNDRVELRSLPQPHHPRPRQSGIYSNPTYLIGGLNHFVVLHIVTSFLYLFANLILTNLT